MRSYTKGQLHPAWERSGARRDPPAPGGGGAPLLGAVALLALAPFALVGLQRTFRSSARHAAATTDAAPAASEPAFPEWVERFAGAAFRSGNEVEVLCNGEQTFPRLWADLEGAGRSVDLQIYYAESGRAADRTVSILAERARAGVRVRLLYDPVGCRGLDGSYLEVLRRAGVRVHPLRPLRLGDADRINHRVHSRIVVVDGAIGYTGDFGISDQWLGDGRSEGSWRSTNARFRGPALREQAAMFAAFWAEATGELAAADGMDAGPAVSPGQRAAVLHSSPGVGITAAERVWSLTFAAARETCYVASGYFAPTPTQAEALARAAERGVDVRVLVAAAPHTDVPPVYWAGRSHYAELLGAGVKLYEYQPSMMHAKSWVVDGTWCSVGALNLDNRSVALNDEVALMVHDRALGARLTQIFMDDLARARRIAPEELARSTPAERAKAWGARQIDPLL